MKKLFLLLNLILMLSFLNGQNTSIPDVNFEQALINLGLDSGPIDGFVLTANIDTIDSLDVSSNFINDLTGIEDFDSLIYLSCHSNQLSALNITQNSSLQELVCWNNQISILDVSQNIQLINLFCFWNQILSLNVSQNPLLSKLICWQNQLSAIDVSQNSALTVLECYTNQILTLDVSQNTLLTTLTCNNNLLTSLNLKNGNNFNVTLFGATNNPNLTCIQVDDSSYSASNWTNIDTQHFFNENCSVGVDELVNENFIDVYPNPASTTITIEVSVKSSENLNLQIIDVNGKIIKQERIYKGTNNISLSKIPKGFYSLIIQSNNFFIANKKIVISH